MNKTLTKEECIGPPDRWQANAERLRNKNRKKYQFPMICPDALRKIEALEQSADKNISAEGYIETSGAISNPFYEADFLVYPPQSWAGDNPYLHMEHMHFDDTITGIIRSLHSEKSIETSPKEALDLRKAYRLYKNLPCFNAQLIIEELGLNSSQAYLYLKLVRIANNILEMTTSRVMPIIPNYSDKDAKDYWRYKNRNNEEFYSKKIWWLITGRDAA